MAEPPAKKAAGGNNKHDDKKADRVIDEQFSKKDGGGSPKEEGEGQAETEVTVAAVTPGVAMQAKRAAVVAMQDRALINVPWVVAGEVQNWATAATGPETMAKNQVAVKPSSIGSSVSREGETEGVGSGLPFHLLGQAHIKSESNCLQ